MCFWLQDLVIPSFLSPELIGSSPLLGFPPKQRTMLAFFKGDMGQHRAPHYSRGLRQKLHALAQTQVQTQLHSDELVAAGRQWRLLYLASTGAAGSSDKQASSALDLTELSCCRSGLSSMASTSRGGTTPTS